MDWLTFIDHLIGHLVWPLTTASLTMFVLVRRRALIERLLHRVRRVEAGRFKAELDQAKAEAEEAELPPAPPLPPWAEPIPLTRPTTDRAEPWLRYLSWLVTSHPRRAVLEAYFYLTDFLLRASERVDPERIRYTSGPPGFAVAVLLAPEQGEVLSRLRTAAIDTLDEGEIISTDQAREYVLLAMRLVLVVQVRLSELPESREPG